MKPPEPSPRHAELDSTPEAPQAPDEREAGAERSGPDAQKRVTSGAARAVCTREHGEQQHANGQDTGAEYAKERTRENGALHGPDRLAVGTESIAQLILGPGAPKRHRGLVWAVLATVSLHGATGALAWHAWRSGASVAPPAKPPAPALRIDHVVELPPPPAKPPPVEPPPPPARAEHPRIRAKVSRPAPKEAPASPPSEPAQAGEVIAAKEAQAPLDFTGFDIASGQAPRYAGGVTASSGRSTTAVAPGGGNGTEGSGPGTSAARPVQLPARNWSCPWPKEADALRIDEQTVVLRVVVTPEGGVTSAELLSDPGHGFGQAALTCARRARFEAAMDRNGQRYLATSPPIRVRFTRR